MKGKGTIEQPIRRIILVPGLLEPRFALWPLKRVLERRCQRVEIFRDRIVFRKLDDSVDRLAEMLRDLDRDGPIGIVTHSFGDWVARQAIARTPGHRVAALVSVAPAMRAGFVLRALHTVSGNLIPEVAVMLDPAKSLRNLDCGGRVRRLVIWAKFDECVRSIDLGHFPHIQVRRVIATHLSVIAQPSVFKIIEQSLFRNTDLR